jgi:hypothetical protein
MSNWLRPDAATSPDRLFFHCYARGRGRADDPGMAVLGYRGAGVGPHVLDADIGCGPARPGRRCDRGDRRAGPAGGGTDHRLLCPALPRPRPGRRHPAALAAAQPTRPANPARVRRGFRNIRQAFPDLASAPKPGKPDPGRPPGSKNRRPAIRHDVGKTVKRDDSKKKDSGQKAK